MPSLDIPGEFLRHAVLDTVVPHASDADLEAALTSALEKGAEDLTSVLSLIPQRSLLFFDEFCTVRVVLRLSNCSPPSLKQYLPHLEVRLDAFAIDPAETVAENPTPTRDLIFSGVVDSQEPLVVVNEFEGDTGGGNHVYVIWSVKAFLKRPRIRIQHPSLLFIASASLNPAETRQQESRGDDYLPPLIPASTNILQPLSSDKSLDQKDPFLPASRLLRVVPAKYSEDPIYNVQQHSGHPIRIVPAASARIRYSRLNAYSGRPTTVASLDFEVTPFLNCDVTFDKAELSMSDGTIETLTDAPGLLPPIRCQPRDDITLVYKLTPDYAPDPNPSTTVMVSVLDISLEAIIHLSDNCNPRILMQWRTNVDFSMVLNPTFGGPSQALQRNNRPASLPMTPNQSNAAAGTATPNRSSLRERAYSTAGLGVSVSFSGPPHVEVGKPFAWSIFIVNRSSGSRKFSIIAIPRRKKLDPRGHTVRPSSSSATSRKDAQVAEAVTDDNIVHALQKSVVGQEAELVSLSTDSPFAWHLFFYGTEIASIGGGGTSSGSLRRLIDTQRDDHRHRVQESSGGLLIRLLGLVSPVRAFWQSFASYSPRARQPGFPSRSPSIPFHLANHFCLSSPFVMFSTSRRRILDGLNRRYIYGRLPLLHAIIFLIEMAAAMRLAAKFNSYYAEKPILTTMVTNAILGGIADTVAQLITAFKARGGRRPSDSNDLISIEIHDLDKEKPPALGELGHARHMPPPFDFERLTRFMSYGFFMAPVQFHWFGFLSRAFPLTKRNPSIPALKRVCVDQLMFAPFGLACFFSFMTVAEGGGRRALTRKFQDVYLPTLKANFVLWPAVQILNFRVVPIQFQIPFVSSVGIAWTAYLSLTNSSEEE
ncbi:protein sym1 [Aspergillus awamori]|uniref:Protein sym1 n=1 Tax=Aspergillus awamori TaxID=105351 RepID=A0A401KT96_ASPAW|nr:protein sym1 [Aspergillus awamori]